MAAASRNPIELISLQSSSSKADGRWQSSKLTKTIRLKNIRFHSFAPISHSNHVLLVWKSSGSSLESYWSGLVRKINDSKTSNGYPTFEKDDKDVLPEVKKVRGVLVNSKQPGRNIGDGDILPETLAKDFCSYYEKLNSKTEKLELFTILGKEFGVNHAHIRALAHDIVIAKERGIATDLKLEEKLHISIEPPYIILLSFVGRRDGGVKFIVDMREDLLNILSTRDLECDRNELTAINHHIRLLLSMWFSVGFFNMQRISWHSPCDITEKVANYEAVHTIRSWLDLKQRIGPYRRCYVFMHPSMPREPVCVLHIALRNDIPGNIQEILAEEIAAEEKDVDTKDTAVFYSVSSTQKGLAEIDLGHSLIKEAVDRMKHELPSIQTFVTLSPIPGFHKWLDLELVKNEQSPVVHNIMENRCLNENEREILEGCLKKPYNVSLRELLSNSSWLHNKDFCEVLKKTLMEVCASYLYIEKKRGFAHDPVANFHLRNGAILWRLNWHGDVTDNGLQSSLGMMVNYRYVLENVDKNTKEYLMSGYIATSPDFMKLLTPSN